jgi:redox-sensing transcriptional repressor
LKEKPPQHHICESFHKASPTPSKHVRNGPRKVSDPAARRLSLYLRALEELAAEERETVSSLELAGRCGINAPQLRKDLSLFGSFGKRGFGYPVAELVPRLREILGVSREWRVVLVGAGRIGAALFEHGEFRERGFLIVGVIDRDPEKIGRRWGDVTIQPAEELEGTITREGADLAILAVPASEAQAVAGRVVKAGVRAILNFAPIRLDVPPNVAVNDVNIGLELEALAFVLAGGTEAP